MIYSLCGLGSVEPYLLFSNQLYIRRFGLRSGELSSVSDHHTFTHAVDYDYDEQMIYYADARDNHIRRMTFDGENDEYVNRFNSAGLEGEPSAL